MNDEALDAPAQAADEASKETPRRGRRRRRGGRGRSSRGRRETQTSEAPPEAEASRGGEPAAGAKATEKAAGSGTRRRRRRRRSGGSGGSAPEAEAPAASSEQPKTKKAEKEPAGRARRGRGGGQGAAPAAEDAAADEAPVKDGPSGRRRRRRGRRGRGAAATAEPTAPAEEKPAKRAPAKKGQAKKAPAKKAPAKKAPAKKASAKKTPAKKASARKRGPVPAAGTRTRARSKPTGRRREPPTRVPRRTDKVMLITEQGDRDQIAVLEGRDLVEHYVTRVGASSMVGNIYLGKVQTVLPGMEAAFVDIGRGRNAVLYSGEVSYDEEVDGDARRIEQVLKPGQGVMVQVTKDPLGGKGARLTGEVSLPGRYLVFVPDGGASGISRRLPEKERARLRSVMREMRPKKGGVIVRTAAEGASEAELKADLERLKKAWDSIRRKSRRGRVPRPLYEEPELTLRVVRDVFSPTEFQKVVTDSKAVHEKVVAYLEDVAPDLLEKVELHEGPLAVFQEYHVAEQIHKALERKVWLPSGGYLIVDRSEAMTIIDVNTGKHVGKTNLEETVAGTNVEAAKEIARQLRLRDIGGIIVIDFIDMLLQRNRDLVIKTLKEALAADRTRSQVFDITPLGLLEMTRKKVSAGLVESFSEMCPTCEGRGILLTHEQ